MAGAGVGLAGRRPISQVDALQVPWKVGRATVLGARHVDRAHREGRSVYVWTINDPNDMETLLDLGVDGLISDRADLLKDVLIARGKWLS